MNLRDLRYVVAVAEHRHFGRAAKACHVSQPTLSSQLAKLEEQFGVTLFERLPRDVQPTEAGIELIARAKAIVTAADDLLLAARTYTDPISGRFRLGVIPTVATDWLPLVLPAVAQAMPKLDLQPIEQQSTLLLQSLEAGELDAAVLALPFDGAESFEITPLYQEAFELAAEAGHPLLDLPADQLTTTALRDARVLLLEQGHCLRDHALAFCTFPGVREDYQGTSLSTLLNLVGIGMGVTLVPELTARNIAVPNLVTRTFKSPAPGRQIALLYRSSSARRAAIDALIAVFNSVDLPLAEQQVKIPR